MNEKNAYLMKTEIWNCAEPFRKNFGVYNQGKEIRVRPKFVEFQCQDGDCVLWITNDNPQMDEFTEQYIMVIKKFDSE